MEAVWQWIFCSPLSFCSHMYLVPHIAQTLEQSQNPAIVAAVQQLISSAVCHTSGTSSLIKTTYVNGTRSLQQASLHGCSASLACLSSSFSVVTSCSFFSSLFWTDIGFAGLFDYFSPFPKVGRTTSWYTWTHYCLSVGWHVFILIH